jgi:hypothetical protein
MRPRTVTVGPLALADDDNIFTSATPSGAGNITLAGDLVTGTVATMDTPRRVLLTTGSDESSKTLILTGTNRDGQVISETFTGASLNATTTASGYDYATVTSVHVSAAFTGALKVGTNGVGSTRWLQLNFDAQPFNVGIAVEVTGTVNYTVQSTYDEIMGHYDPGGINPIWVTPGVPVTFDDPVGGSIASDEFQLLTPVNAVRVTLNSGSGSISAVIIQAGIIG